MDSGGASESVLCHSTGLIVYRNQECRVGIVRSAPEPRAFLGCGFSRHLLYSSRHPSPIWAFHALEF